MERCPPLPHLSNATVSTLLTGVGTVVTVVCHQGHKLTDNTGTKDVECLPDKMWSHPVEDCRGDHSVLLKILQYAS